MFSKRSSTHFRSPTPIQPNHEMRKLYYLSVHSVWHLQSRLPPRLPCALSPSPAQPSPAQPNTARPSTARPSPAQPSPAQPSPAQPAPLPPPFFPKTHLILIESSEEAGDEGLGEGRRDEAAEDGVVNAARGGATHQVPESLLQVHDLLQYRTSD
jgi:hypothetical protein